MATKDVINDVIDKFSALSIKADAPKYTSTVEKTIDYVTQDEIDDLTNSIQKLTVECKTKVDVDELCDLVDNMCIEKGVNSHIIKALICWYSGRCGMGEIPIHIPHWGECK